ncbi:MAG: hypothetical protein EA421_06320 [Gemmatimonadales bacterium]|nr:MAG: hypothetical protein EA421_06320 [Gemmatimonadales bacterium]
MSTERKLTPDDLDDGFPSGIMEIQSRPLAAAVAICVAMMLLGSLLGAMVGRDVEVGWYEALTKPDFEAPWQVFLLVSVLYYPLFALVLYRGLTRIPQDAPRRQVVGLAVAALLLNTIWNPVVIGLRDPFVGVVGTAVLLILVLVLVLKLVRRDRVSAFLLVPYLLWVVYDLVWSWELWRLNPGA